MFKALQPLIAERGIHILLSPAKDGKVGVYVEPVKLNDKEDHAFVTPFRCEGTPEELDAELSGVLAQWLTSRAAVTTSLRDALAAAEAQAKAAADDAKKKAADKNKKPTPVTTSKATTPAKAAGPVTPSLLDTPASTGGDDDEDEEGGESTSPAETPAPEAAATSATTVAAAEPAAVSAPVAEAAAPVAAALDVLVAAAPAPVEPTEPPPAPASVVTSDPVTAELF